MCSLRIIFITFIIYKSEVLCHIFIYSFYNRSAASIELLFNISVHILCYSHSSTYKQLRKSSTGQVSVLPEITYNI